MNPASRWDKVMPRVKSLQKLKPDYADDEEYDNEDSLLK